MTAGTFFFVVMGVAYVTSWLFKVIDIIERKPNRARRARGF